MYTVDHKLKSKSECNKRGSWIGINRRSVVCFSKFLVFMQYNISPV